MLEIVKNWVIAITIAVLIGALLEALLPQSSIKKYVKTAICIMILLIIVSPVVSFLKGDTDIKSDLNGIFGNITEQIQKNEDTDMSLYKDYVYDLYMRNKSNKNE